MATARLTKTTVEAAAPSVSDIYLWDELLGRFGLKVTPAGSRIYLVQYRTVGSDGRAKTRRITIGQHGRPWTVDQARVEAKRLLARVDLDQDPFADREADRAAKRAIQHMAAVEAAAAEARARDSFEAVAQRFIDLRAKKNRSWAETERLLKHGPIAAWSGRHIGDVRRADVADLIDQISLRSPAIARATFAAVRPLFSWCLERDLISTSPCEGLRAPPRPRPRERVLSDDEIRLAWEGADLLSGRFGAVIKLLILTGQRRSEVAGMRWSELDLVKGIWSLPGSRTKNGRDHQVDLSEQALAVIAGLEKGGDLLFPARGEGAVNGFSATKRQLNRRVVEAARAKEAELSEEDLPDASAWRIHDLRRTAATGMAALGFAPHVIERVLNHVSGSQGGLIGVYQRHEYRTERRAAMVAWGAHVEGVVNGAAPSDNVAHLADHRR